MGKHTNRCGDKREIDIIEKTLGRNRIDCADCKRPLKT
jgi:hypothetical protein